MRGQAVNRNVQEANPKKAAAPSVPSIVKPFLDSKTVKFENHRLPSFSSDPDPQNLSLRLKQRNPPSLLLVNLSPVLTTSNFPAENHMTWSRNYELLAKKGIKTVWVSFSWWCLLMRARLFFVTTPCLTLLLCQKCQFAFKCEGVVKVEEETGLLNKMWRENDIIHETLLQKR